MKGNKNNERSKIWLILSIIFVIAALAGGVLFFIQSKNREKAASDYGELQEAVNEPKQEKTEETKKEESQEEEKVQKEPEKDVLAERGIQVPEKNLDWAALKEENSDIYAWITVPGTTVDYPVVQHPSDNSFYLDHNLDGSQGYPGCIYSEDYNKKDFTDPHTVLYGHNLKDKSMFSTLHNFADASVFAQPHYAFLYTKEHVFVYELFAAYEFPAIHLLDNYDLENTYVYSQYIKDIFNIDQMDTRVANIRKEVKVTEEDRILTLSTCTTDHDAGIRFLVVGVLLNP